MDQPVDTIGTMYEDGALRAQASVNYAARTFIINPVGFAVSCKYRISLPAPDMPDSTRKVLTFVGTSTSGENKPCIAIMEFKRRGNLDIQDYQTGFAESSSEAHIRDALNKVDRGTGTLLSSDHATAYFRQAVAFHATMNCRFIVFFDWDTMIFLKFPDKNDHRSEARNCCPDTYILGRSKRHNFRKFLLGFVLEACEAAGIEEL